MGAAVTRYADALRKAISDPNLEDKLRDLVGDWKHPYLRSIPHHISVEDVRRLRELQRWMFAEDTSGKRFTDGDVQLLTAGRVSLGTRAAKTGILPSEMRETYANLPDMERKRAERDAANADVKRLTAALKSAEAEAQEISRRVAKMREKRNELIQTASLFGLEGEITDAVSLDDIEKELGAKQKEVARLRSELDKARQMLAQAKEG